MQLSVNSQYVAHLAEQPIAFICHPYHRGGVTRWMADAAIKYGSEGRKVYFVTVVPKNRFFSAGKAETMAELVMPYKNVVQIVTESVTGEFELGLPEYRIEAYTRLMQQHLPVGTAVIVSDDPDVWAAAAAMRASFLLVGVLHADEVNYFDLASKYAASFDFYACVSKRVAAKLADRVPAWPRARMAVIPCGIKLPMLQPQARATKVCRLVYVGRLTEYQKRISDLLNVALKLRELKFDFQLTIVGDGGADKLALQAAVQNAGMGECIKFAGWMAKEAVAAILDTSDVMIMTSDFEGTPVAMMEALAAGCGFVGTRVSGIEDYEWVEGSKECFRIFEVGATGDAAQKIVELASIPFAQRTGAARLIAESHFDMATCLHRYDEAIAGIFRPCQAASAPKFGVAGRLKSRLLYTMRVAKLRLASSRASRL